MAPDFFEYFRALYPILRSDPTLWCVSAWNDNGRDALVDPSKPELLYRTDFFPGLGWMLLKEMWDELEPKWPLAFWDDWMRQPEQRKDRSCIRPEISRTITFGRKGVSLGQFFDQYLRYIKLNTQFVPFTKQNLSYLLKEKYDETFIKEVYSAPLVKIEELQQGGSLKGPGPYRVQYSSRDSFKVFARNLGVMDDLKSGVPRTGYRGVVSFLYRGRRVFLAPPEGWMQYDISWSWETDPGSTMQLGLKRGESLTQRSTLSNQRISADAVVHEGMKAAQVVAAHQWSCEIKCWPRPVGREASKLGCSFRISKFRAVQISHWVKTLWERKIPPLTTVSKQLLATCLAFWALFFLVCVFFFFFYSCEYRPNEDVRSLCLLQL